MKKLLLFAIVLFTFASCEKEDIYDCNCGIVMDDGIDSGYWVTIRSDCSNNVKKWYLSEGDWMNAHPGDTYCITDSDGW